MSAYLIFAWASCHAFLLAAAIKYVHLPMQGERVNMEVGKEGSLYLEFKEHDLTSRDSLLSNRNK
jgi:hypothetical protein